MTYQKKYYAYLISLFLFKLAVGAILLVVSWDVLILYKDSVLSAALIMALSFLPAAFSRPLFNRFSFLSTHTSIIFYLWLAAALIMAEYLSLSDKSYFAFFLNFILWIFIFAIEASFEKWYVILSKNIPFANIRKLSGISTGVGQIGVITGPMLVIFSKNYGYSTTYWMILLTFFLASLAPIYLWHKTKKTSYIIQKQSTNLEEVTEKRQKTYIFAFSLIWPTLAIFNISAPLLAKIQYDSIHVAGGMEVIIGITTATAGFIHSFITKILTHKTRLYCAFFILTLSIFSAYFYDTLLILVFISTGLTGLSFGYLRVELRSFLSHRFTPIMAGKIIAAANSWSGPLVLIYCFIFYINSAINMNKGILITLPLSFIIAGLAFSYVLFTDAKFQEEN